MTDEPRYIEFLRESNAIEGVYDERSLADAIEAWQYLIKKKKIGLATILKAHRMLMRNTDLAMHEKGALRKIPVYIGGHEALRHGLIPQCMKGWVIEANVKAFDFETIKKLHVRFEQIHPFVDGNGRIGRMLMNWQVVRQLREVPIVIRESGRQRYYDWFRAEPQHGPGSKCPIDFCPACRAIDEGTHDI